MNQIQWCCIHEHPQSVVKQLCTSEYVQIITMEIFFSFVTFLQDTKIKPISTNYRSVDVCPFSPFMIIYQVIILNPLEFISHTITAAFLQM